MNWMSTFGWLQDTAMIVSWWPKEPHPKVSWSECSRLMWSQSDLVSCPCPVARSTKPIALMLWHGPQPWQKSWPVCPVLSCRQMLDTFHERWSPHQFRKCSVMGESRNCWPPNAGFPKGNFWVNSGNPRFRHQRKKCWSLWSRVARRCKAWRCRDWICGMSVQTCWTHFRPAKAFRRRMLMAKLYMFLVRIKYSIHFDTWKPSCSFLLRPWKCWQENEKKQNEEGTRKKSRSGKATLIRNGCSRTM